MGRPNSQDIWFKVRCKIRHLDEDGELSDSMVYSYMDDLEALLKQNDYKGIDIEIEEIT